MLVTTITDTDISTLTLPKKVSGRFWVKDSSDVSSHDVVSVEGKDNKWVITSNKKYYIVDAKNKKVKSRVIKPNNVYVLYEVKNQDNKLYVFTEPISEDRQIFKKYIFDQSIVLTIGRTDDNDLSFSNRAVSSHHAYLKCEEGHWAVHDNTSTNGTFVNNKRVHESQLLKYGDCVYVMGLKILIGKNLIAINNPDNTLKVSGKLINYVPQDVITDVDEDIEEVEIDYFYRSPRFKRDIETAEFQIDSPPTSPIADEMPMGLVLGSSLAMGMMSVVTLCNAIVTKNVLTMAMGGSMLIGTVLLPVITKTYEKRRKRRKEMLRQKRYQEYLEKVAVKIDEECQVQSEILHENIVPVEECKERILGRKRNLWDRSIEHNDFLRVRVGTGSLEPDLDLHYSGKKFTIEDDNLQEAMYVLAEKKKELKDVPISYSLQDDFVSGVIGKRDSVLQFSKNLIVQLASMYSYDEVKFVFIINPDEYDDFSFVKWLPHVWSDDKKFRFVATNESEVKEISAYLSSEIEKRLDMNEDDLEDCTPYYLIFLYSKTLAVRSELVKSVVSNKDNIHYSLLTFYDELRNLPKESSMVVELDDGTGKLYDKNDVSGHVIDFNIDMNEEYDINQLSLALANTQLNNLESNAQLPSMVKFLSMFGVGKIEHLNTLDRWKDNDPTISLEAPVGVDNLGGLFKLDLHEKFHGPHGLVAGTTGSGKSEFIITYILSLAINYHPHEVAFILIDYKGGGMAKSFSHLPHTVGIITNLDGAAIKRSLVSIESELKRRQAIFAAASKKVQISNIDIYKYQKLYREGLVDEPLQHLFIISDEFAELKTQQPEFMTQLVSAARIGRSLGVHLILATQKPSGVVDDQIWSNSRFKVCLKVQDKADSMDMLKRADAAELSDTGRFYLQVGYNELFEIGQSAWSGAPYYPSDSADSDRDISVSIIDTNGQPIKSSKLDKNRTLFKNAPKQVDAITEYLQIIAKEADIKVKPLWLDPIPAVILVDDLYKKYKVKTDKFILNPVVGEYDDPARQRQAALTLPLTKNGNTLIYGAAGSGKDLLVNSIIYSLITRHTPEEVNLYMLDFASETLGMFSDFAHVGEVMLSFDEEKINNFFKMLIREIRLRKKLFSEYGGEYVNYIQSSEDKMSQIVVVIDNFAAFAELYPKHEDDVTYLTRDGSKYGIYFVVTSVGINGVRFRLLQNFKQLVALQLNDDADYTSVVGKTEGLLPSKIRGRGLIRLDRLYEFQSASIVGDNTLRDYIRAKAQQVNINYSESTKAKNVAVLPDKVDYEFLKNDISAAKDFILPIGVNTETLDVVKYSFTKMWLNLVLSNGSSYADFASNIINMLTDVGECDVFGLNMSSSFSFKESKNTSISCDNDQLIKQIDCLFDISVKRNNKYKDAKNKNKCSDGFKSVFVIFNSFGNIYSRVEGDTKEKLQLILDKNCDQYKMYFVICDSANSVSPYSFENWYKNNASGNNGIWIGSGIADQYVLKPNKIDSVLRQPVPDDFGYIVHNGNTLKLKVISSQISGDLYG